MTIKTFGVVGAGQMGNGIAQVAAQFGGLNVIMNDIADQFVEKGHAQSIRLLPGEFKRAQWPREER